MASVQARHSRLCAREGAWTRAREAGKADGCTCRSMFYVVFRDGAGKLIRERAGPNRQRAERLRDKRSVELFEGSYQPVQTVAFRGVGAALALNAGAQGEHCRLLRVDGRLRHRGVRRPPRQPARPGQHRWFQSGSARAGPVRLDPG